MKKYITKSVLAVLAVFAAAQQSVFAAADSDLVTAISGMTGSVSDNIPAIRTGLVTVMGVMLILALFVMGYRRVKGMVK